MSEKANVIATDKEMFDISTIKSKKVTVIAGSSFEAKKGHLVFMDDTTGKYTAYPVSQSLIPVEGEDETPDTSPKGAVGVLMEDASLSTGDTTVLVAIAGTVFYDFVRAAGIDATKAPDWVLDMYSAKQSQILFLGKED